MIHRKVKGLRCIVMVLATLPQDKSTNNYWDAFLKYSLVLITDSHKNFTFKYATFNFLFANPWIICLLRIYVQIRQVAGKRVCIPPSSTPRPRPVYFPPAGASRAILTCQLHVTARVTIESCPLLFFIRIALDIKFIKPYMSQLVFFSLIEVYTASVFPAWCVLSDSYLSTASDS